jgi:hypothetical protein
MTPRRQIGTITVHEAYVFRPGDRVEFRPPARWYVRAWRWLTKDNYRVATVERDALTLERCR